MGWEQRNGLGGHSYYYLKERIGDKVVSRYVQPGSVALFVAAGELVKAEREEQRLFQQAQEVTDKLIDETCRRIDAVIRGLLYAAGFHRHKRQWRKQLMPKKDAIAKAGPKTIDDLPEQMKPWLEFTELAFQAINQGDNPPPALVDKMRSMLVQHPDLWRYFGDLTDLETDKLIRDAWCGNVGAQESVKIAVEHLKVDMGYPEASPLERLAINEIVIAWVRLSEVQNRHTSAMHNRNGTRHETAEFWDRRLMYSQRRYLRACESLARIRKLSKRVSIIQVNVAENGGQQVNIAAETRLPAA
jgi:hypothetical protein